MEEISQPKMVLRQIRNKNSLEYFSRIYLMPQMEGSTGPFQAAQFNTGLFERNAVY